MTKLDKAINKLNFALMQIESGFVPCNRCGDQESTNDLDFVVDIEEAVELLEGIRYD